MPEVSAVVAAVCASMFVLMSADAARQRARHRVPMQGLGENKHVNRAVRIHGNFAEHVPLALLLMMMLELRGTPAPWLWTAGGSLVVGRGLHWIGLKRTSGTSVPRMAGVGLTWAVLAGEAVGLVVSVVG